MGNVKKEGDQVAVPATEPRNNEGAAEVFRAADELPEETRVSWAISACRHIRKRKLASWNSTHCSRVDLATSCIGRLQCPHSVEVCSSLSSLLAYRPLRSRSRKATRAAGPQAARHQQMMPAAGPPMALTQIPARPQPATPTVRPTIAPALLRDQNRPEVRNQLRQRRLRRSGKPAPFPPGQTLQSGASSLQSGASAGFRVYSNELGSPTSLWGGPDLKGAERASNAKWRLRMWGRCAIRSEVSLF